MMVPVSECPAGSAMDGAIARVLGYKVVLYLGQFMIKASDGLHDDPEPYSTDIAAAWEMEGALSVDRQADYVMALFNLVTVDLGAPDFSTFSKAVYWRMVHASPLDRCRAFLRANGVEVLDEGPWSLS